MTTFSGVNPVSPVSTQSFIWLAEYCVGGLTEFDLETGAENKFQTIDKDRLVRFGLIGHNRKLWFESTGGTFNIAGRRIDLAFATKAGQQYNLTGNDRLRIRDIITFKKAVADVPNSQAAIPKTGTLVPHIVAYYYGYKIRLDIDGVDFTFKPIVSLPLNKPAYMAVHIMADRELDGRMIFMTNGEESGSIDGLLVKDKASQINWCIK